MISSTLRSNTLPASSPVHLAQVYAVTCISPPQLRQFRLLPLLGRLHVSYSFGLSHCRTTPRDKCGLGVIFLRAPLCWSVWKPEHRHFPLFKPNTLGMPTEFFGPTQLYVKKIPLPPKCSTFLPSQGNRSNNKKLLHKCH